MPRPETNPRYVHPQAAITQQNEYIINQKPVALFRIGIANLLVPIMTCFVGRRERFRFRKVKLHILFNFPDNYSKELPAGAQVASLDVSWVVG